MQPDSKKVITLKGNNTLVGNKIEKGVHCGVRNDFNETATGLLDFHEKTER